MSLFKKPSELTAKPGIVAMIYGTPGSGKSTLACSAPGAVMLDYDGGVNRINGAHQVPTLQVHTWEETAEALKEIKESPEIKTVLIDTVGKQLAFMEDYIKRNVTYSKGGNAVETNRDGSLSIKGFGRRKQMFIDFIKEITVLGKNVIFIAHDKEEKDGDFRYFRPDVGGSSGTDLMRELDLVGYMQIIGNERTITFTPTGAYYAKDTCGMPGIIKLPVLINEKGENVGDNNFFCHVIDNYRNRIKSNLDNNKKLDALKLDIQQNLEYVNDAETANKFVEWCQSVNHIYNSAAIAKNGITKKAKELGLKFNPMTKQYIDSDSEDSKNNKENDGINA
ncbi:MAG: ATP-binding protein [Bacteroidales bacterium]|nr:ATP-binding protein [Bacteroidales bacterium]